MDYDGLFGRQCSKMMILSMMGNGGNQWTKYRMIEIENIFLPNTMVNDYDW